MKTAPKFAEKLVDILNEKRITQQKLADTAKLHRSAISRFCRQGTGSSSNVEKILEVLQVPPCEAYKIIALRNAELSTGYAAKIWQQAEKKPPDELEYLAELVPGDTWRAYACAALGISIKKIKEIAHDCNIEKIHQLNNVNPWDFLAFKKKIIDIGDKGIAEELLAREPQSDYSPIMLLDFLQTKDADAFVPLSKSTGQVHFGLPHTVISKYDFEKNGEVGKHKHHYGIELVCSLKGRFKLTYDKKEYKLPLKPEGDIYIYDARREHSLRLVDDDPGILIIVRYCPTKRDLEPKEHQI